MEDKIELFEPVFVFKRDISAYTDLLSDDRFKDELDRAPVGVLAEHVIGSFHGSAQWRDVHLLYVDLLCMLCRSQALLDSFFCQDCIDKSLITVSLKPA